MAIYSLAPNVKRQFLDDSGVILSGGLLYIVSAGGSYPADAATTYQTSSGTAHSQPITLDSSGRIAGSSELYLQPGQSYRFIIKNSAGVQLWNQDNITAVPLSAANVDLTKTAGEALSAGDVVYIAKGTEGGTVAGSLYKTDADAAATSSDALTVGMVPDAIASGSQGTMRIEGDVTVTGPLTLGTAYFVSGTPGALSSTEGTHSRYVGQASSTTVITIVPNPISGQGLNLLQIEALLG